MIRFLLQGNDFEVQHLSFWGTKTCNFIVVLYHGYTHVQMKVVAIGIPLLNM